MEGFLEGIGLVAQILAFALLVAAVIERLVEKFVKPPLKRILPEFYADAAGYVALALGVAFSWAFGIDIFTPVAMNIGLEPFVPWIGYLLTGLAVGAGGNFLHDVWPGQGNAPARDRAAEIR